MRTTLAIVLALFATACAKAPTNTNPTKTNDGTVFYGPTPGGHAPLVTLFNEDGTEMTLEGLRGEVVLLNFWATWCGPCIEEMPSLQTLHEKMEPDGLQVLAVSVDEEPDLAFDYATEHELTFRLVFDRRAAAANAYKVRTIPVTFLIDRDGKIVSKVRGARDWTERDMVDQIEDVLGQKKG